MRDDERRRELERLRVQVDRMIADLPISASSTPWQLIKAQAWVWWEGNNRAIGYALTVSAAAILLAVLVEIAGAANG